MHRDLDRRTVLRSLALSALAGCAPRRATTLTTPLRSESPSKLSAELLLSTAREAAAFIKTLEVPTKQGLLWRKSHDRADEHYTDLYHGSVGPVIFLLELHRATGEAAYLEAAARGADQLIATLPDHAPIDKLGLYGGLPGWATALRELHATTNDARFQNGERLVLDRVAATVDEDAKLSGWNDVLYGGAGIVLWLLWAGRDDASSREVAIATKIGDGLLANATAAEKGSLWLMRPSATYEMPNFSHGTAGVAYALARLAKVTGEERFLDGARAGAAHLIDIAYTDGGVCLIPHATDTPASRMRYYLGVCHGPPGVARLFLQLHRATGEKEWLTWYRRCVDSIVWSGLPEARTPGYWDNVSQCCGASAIVEFLLDASIVTGDASLVDLARRMSADVIARGRPAAAGGTEWVHAENRVEPYWKQSFVGYMQGAAGIGSGFLRLASHGTTSRWKVRLPDAPALTST
jgi:lantibiotic modifying enzyme